MLFPFGRGLSYTQFRYRDLTEEQIGLVMSSFGKRAEEKRKGDRSVSETASRALQVNMPMRSLVSFGAMQEDGLQAVLRVLRGE